MTEITEFDQSEYEQKMIVLQRTGVDEEIMMHAAMIVNYAPYAKGKFPMSKSDGLFVALRCREMGVHPLNDKAVQVYKDAHGIHVDYHYSLIAKYVSQLRKVRHTQPHYFRLTPEQLEDEGLAPTDVAYYATFIPFDALDDYYRMMDKLTPDEAYKLFAVTGIGSVDKAAWDKDYFASNGRSKAWKVQKRALKDAYIKWLGYPSPSEARFLQYDQGWKGPSIEDAKYSVEVAEGIAPHERVELMQSHARREALPPMTEAELRDVGAALYGDPVTIEKPATLDPAAEAEMMSVFQAEAEAGKRGTPAISDMAVEARPQWTSFEAAIAWAIAQGAFGNPADSGTAPHARNAYNKLRDEIDPDNAPQMFDAWYSDVLRRMQA